MTSDSYLLLWLGSAEPVSPDATYQSLPISFYSLRRILEQFGNISEG